MRIVSTFIVCYAIFSGLTHARTDNDYTGIWKNNCTNYFGIQIKPAERDLYSVTFCGVTGCFAPGTWTPNSTIEGDPKYKVITPNTISIKLEDSSDSLVYEKCTSDPVWLVEKSATTENLPEPECHFSTTSDDEGVLIAWITGVRETTQFGANIEIKTTKVGAFRPVAILRESSIVETQGSSIHKNQRFWPVLDPTSEPVKLISVSSFLDHMNVDHCVYSASIREVHFPRGTLLSNQPLPGIFRAPTASERTDFYRLNTKCVNQGDYPPEETPPCVRAELLAVTDFNHDNNPEYWATEPYIWDTGLSVWEKKGKLSPLLQVCVGCSD
ncbi:MAG: hypothetical protein GY834_02625 [Bacteroidetes bacterium]|nr:hypothetical protein [Bacteroidota bacterium]